jgi:iron complex outermembrane recepter protein
VKNNEMRNFAKVPFACIIILISICSYGQADTGDQSDYDSLSLKDLLNIKIVSVSKQSETLFDAPLSASVVTKEDMRKAGCTSIMEAMRLVPGMIVREQSNGNYDIHLRGMDNVPPDAPFDANFNTTTLVMINNRPIYSYLRGGTFWETLPIDLNDVEKIEVIRGPAAALYGPNAVSGVINIITRQPKKQGLYLVANNQLGSYHTSLSNVSIGYKSGKWNTILSGNYQERNRTQTSYFEFYRNQEMELSDYFIDFNTDTIRNIRDQYPDPHPAMKKYAGNIFVNYENRDKIRFALAAGIQHSHVQKVAGENQITPLSNAESDSRYVDLRANIKNLSAQVSYKDGTQIIKYQPGSKYDFHTLDAGIEYNFARRNFSLKPGLSYSNAVYEDAKYADLTAKTGIFNGKGRITTISGSLRGEQKLLNNKIRLVAGVAASKFNYPDDTYISYQFGATVKPNKKHLFRAVFSRAPRSSTVLDTYIDQTVVYEPIGYRQFMEVVLKGNKDLRPLKSTMIELGYRLNVTSGINLDIEAYDIHTRDHNSYVIYGPHAELRGDDTIIVTPIASTNLPLKLNLRGITASLSWNYDKLLVKPFITLQRTVLKNYAHTYAAPDASPYHIYSEMGKKDRLKSTPTVFGGLFTNYELSPAININLNAYYYTQQTYSHFSHLMFNDERGTDQINGKLILNLSLSYEPIKRLRLFCTGKNILNNKNREFFHTDATPFMLTGGLNYEL